MKSDVMIPRSGSRLKTLAWSVCVAVGVLLPVANGGAQQPQQPQPPPRRRPRRFRRPVRPARRTIRASA